MISISPQFSRFFFPVIFATLFFGQPAFAQETSAPENSEIASQLLHWKMFDIHPRLAVSAIYDDNITLRETNRLSDVFYTIAPGFSAIAGDTLSGESPLLSVDYGANLQFFTEHNEFNAIDHATKVSGLLPFAKLTLGVTATFEKASTPDVQIGGRIPRTIYGLGLTARYAFSLKTSFEVNGGYSRTDYDDSRLISSQQFYNENWVNNQVSSKINLGLGLTLGKLTQDRGPDETYERILLRGIYNLSYKLDVTASAGGEFRQFNAYEHITGFRIIVTGSGFTTVPIITQEKATSQFSPVFNIGATYRPREGTTIRFEAFRRDQNSSILTGLNYIATGFSVNIQQQFLERFSAGFGGTFQNSSYNSTSKMRNLDRDENFYAVNANLDFLITKRWVAGLRALHRTSESSAANGTIYDNNQVALQTSYQF